jgi:hypothetical protein
MTQTFIRILGALALSTSLLACMADEEMSEADKDAFIREGEAEYTRLTARHVDESASLAAAAADPAIVPLVVEVYNDPFFEGTRRNIVFDEPRFAYGEGCQYGLGFENVTTSVVVRKGPDYATFKATHGEPYAVLYEHPDFQGRRLVLGVGGYSDLRLEGFENVASSLKFTTQGVGATTPNVPDVTPMTQLTAIVQAHRAPYLQRCSIRDYALTLVRTSGDLGRDFGKPFNDTISYIEIIPTSTFDPAGVLTLFEHDEFAGAHHGVSFSQRLTHLDEVGFDNKTSSYRRSF